MKPASQPASEPAKGLCGGGSVQISDRVDVVVSGVGVSVGGVDLGLMLFYCDLKTVYEIM